MPAHDLFLRKRALRAWALFACGLAFAAMAWAAAEAPLKPDSASVGGTRVEDGALALRVALSHAVYNQATPRTLALKVDLVSPAAPPADRPPLNLALILDRSGSMAEDKKFAYTVEAARAVIENLSERDIVSLIAYNDRALVLSPAGKVVNKAFLFHRLDDISPEGPTDLSAGLLEGIAQVNSKSAEGQIKHVLLLTDGLANRGVTSDGAIRKIVEKAKAKGVGVSTLGCGTEFNEKLLTAMATAGGGRYTYVRSAEQLPTAFQQELGGLLEVVAQNVRLELTVTQGGLIREVHGQLLERPVPAHEMNIGNWRAGERGVLIAELTPSQFKPDAAIEVAVKLTFDDPQTSERVQRVSSARASFASAVSAQSSRENQEVVLYCAVMDALDSAVEGLEGFDQERYGQARKQFDQRYNQARTFALANRNQDLLNQTFLLKHFMEELEAARAEGKIHDHTALKAKFDKESDYRRYLLFHHKAPR